MPYIGKQPTVGNFQVCDAISVVNGQAAYTMQVGGSNVEPENANHMLVSLNGILQKPGSSFTISGSTITFASNLATGDVIDFITLLGDTLNTGAPSDDTDELLISDAGTLKRIDVSLVGGKNTPNFKVDLSANISVANSTNVKITWDVEQWDTANAFASNKFTVPSGQGGKYFFHAQYIMADLGGSDKQMQIKLFKNGSEISYGYNRGERDRTCEINTVLNLSANDYIEVYARQNGGTTVNLLTDAAGTHFLGFKLIE